MNRLLLLGLFLIVLDCPGQTEDYLSHFTEFEINTANTAKNAEYLIQAEKDIFLYNNLARMYPRKFYNLYKEFVLESSYKAEMFTTDHYYTTLTTELLNRPPAGPLLPDLQMFELAECWALESGAKGIVGHDRIECEGGFWAENCSYGYSDGLDIVMQLLIDHSVESLGHRKNMLNASYKGLGVAVRSHKGYRFCAVQDFTYTNDVIRAEDEVKKQEAAAQQKEEDRKMEIRSGEFDIAMDKWTNEEKSNADICRSLTYLNDLEKDFYFYANLIRLYPKKFKEVLWDKGPYFDQLLVDLQAGLHQEAGYKSIANYLKTAPPGSALVPNETATEKGRCVMKAWSSGSSNISSCLNGSGSWQIQSYYADDDYHDIMKFLMDAKTFNALFNQQTTILIADGMKAMVR
jgi:hypothetical protein